MPPIAVCLIIAVLVVLVNQSAVLASRSPTVAASLFYANAGARARLAQQEIIADRDPIAARRVIALVRDAVARDPIVPVALSAAGMAFEFTGEPVRTRPAMLLANRLSRRVLPVQLWLIEDAVQRGDVPAALHHYDVALRTNKQASAILFPILNAAVDDPRMVDPIARLLARRPVWRSDFTSQLVEAGPLDGAATLATKLAALRSPLPDEYASVLMLRLSGVRDYPRALAVFRANFPKEARAGALVRDPAFATPRTALPFGWQFVDGSDLGVAPMAGGRPGVQLYRSAGASGEAGRQLVTLPPGSYRLVADYANAAVTRGAEPRWQVVCGSEAAPVLAELLLAGATARRRTESMFTVPAQGCPAQWIFLSVPPATGEATLSVDLASLVIAHARR